VNRKVTQQAAWGKRIAQQIDIARVHKRGGTVSASAQWEVSKDSHQQTKIEQRKN